MRTYASVLLLAAASAALLAGCGQKGPLYLPEKSGAVVTTPAAPAAPATPTSAPPPGSATPAAPPPQTAPAPGAATPSAPAPQKKQNGDDDSLK